MLCQHINTGQYSTESLLKSAIHVCRTPEIVIASTKTPASSTEITS